MLAPRLPNRWRITVWIVLSVLLVTFVVGLVAVNKVRSGFTAQMDEELVAEAAGIEAALSILSPEQLDRIAEDTNQLGLGDGPSGMVFSRADGTVITIPSRTGDRDDPPIDTGRRALGELRARAGTPFDLTSADGTVTYRAIVRQQDDGGLIVILRPLSVRDEAVQVVIRILALAGLAAAALISITVAVVSSIVTRPLDAMIDTAEEIGAGDLTSRVPTSGVDDVSRLAVALNRMLDRLEVAFADREASEEALRRFVSDASHELRTPLATVIGYAELHQGGMAPPDRLDDSLERIRSEGERMRVMVEDLLALARLDEDGPRGWERVDLGELAGAAVTASQVIDPDRPHRLDDPDEPVVIDGDPHSLRQALDNLLANARVHTDPATPVTVSVRSVGPEARITVADEGAGMSAEDAAHIFERFYRTDRSRSRPPGSGTGGSGLGLAIVAAVATAHHGEATVETAPGSGAKFTITIPRPTEGS